MVPEEAFQQANVTSATSEADPRPSVGVSDREGSELRIVATGDHDRDFLTRVTTAGYPGAETGPGVIARLSSEDATAWRTWNGPSHCLFSSKVKTIDESTVFAGNFFRPDLVRMAWAKTFGVAHAGEFHVYNFDDDTWTTTTVESSKLPSVVTAVEDNRLVYITGDGSGGGDDFTVYLSDDDGATWSEYSSGQIFEPALGGTLTAAVLHYHPPTRSLLLLTNERQYASTDGGVSFQQVSLTSPDPTQAHADVSPDGSIWVAYMQDGNFKISRIESPTTPYTSGNVFSSIVTSSESMIWVDEDGTPYYQINATGIEDQLYVSYDSQSFRFLSDYFPLDWVNGSGSVGGLDSNLASTVCARGFHIQVVYTGSNDSNEGSIVAHFLGGWNNLQMPVDRSISASEWAGPAVRWNAPARLDGSVSPSANSWDGPAYTISTTASQEFFPDSGFVTLPAAYGADNNVDEGFAFFLDIEPVSGGALTDLTRGASIRCSLDASNYYELELRVSMEGYRVYDKPNSAAVGTDQTFTRGARVQILLVCQPDGTVLSYHREPTSPFTPWVAGIDSTTGTGKVAADSGLAVGHITSGTAETIVRGFHISALPADAAAFEPTNTAWRGRRLSPTAYPVPGLSSDSSARDTYLKALTGPGILAETHTFVPVYTYGTDFLSSVDDGSYARAWRSTATTEQTIEWEFAAPRELRAPAVCVVRSNVRSLVLESWSGSAWVEVATYSPGITFTYARSSGSAVIVPSGTTTGNRFIRENELAGAWVDLGSSKLRRIRGNRAGSTNGDAELRTRIYLDDDDYDDTEPTSGTCTVYPHTGLLLTRTSVIPSSTRWRIRIPSGNSPEGYWTIGSLLVGRFQPLGLQPSHGWSHGLELNAVQTRSARGVVRRSQRGPNRRAKTWAWQDPTDQTWLHSNADDPDWIGDGSVDDRLVAYRDVHTQLFGILHEVKGGELPVVQVGESLEASATITDPESFLHGTLVVEAVQANNVWGDEASDDIYRVESVTVEELVG